MGTAGQTQTTAFDSPEAARKSFEKRVEAKLKQGYQDADVASGESAAPVQTSAVTEAFQVRRSLNLNPEDWLWASWKHQDPLPKPACEPFNLKRCLARFERVMCDYVDNYVVLDWSRANISISLSTEEACFWLQAMTHPNWVGNSFSYSRRSVRKVAASLSQQSFADVPSVEEICDRLQRIGHGLSPSIVNVLYSLNYLLPVAVQRHLSESTYVFSEYTAEHFRVNIWGHLADEEIERLRAALRPGLQPEEPFHRLYLLAAYLGMHEEVKQRVDSWQQHPRFPDYIAGAPQENIGQSDAVSMVLGLGQPQAIKAAAHRLNTLLTQPKYVRGWLACTALSDLGWINHSILNAYDKSQQQILLKTFTQSVQAPEAAPYILELLRSVSKPKLARQWLTDNLVEAVVGLIPVAAGQVHEPVEISADELIEAAVNFLVSVHRRGNGALLEFALKDVDDPTMAAIQARVLNVEKAPANVFDESTTPQWLTRGIDDISRRKEKLKVDIDWVHAADLPSIEVDSRCLNQAQSQSVLAALKLSLPMNPLKLVKAVKQHGTAESIDAFIWSLFERWLAEGADSKELWALHALGHLGSDVIALKLTPLIRKWPGVSQHHRAVHGLTCLRAIGSDTALMQLNGIAQKVKYRGIQRRAQDCMAEIARDRNLTAAQLEDRIVPDCGLDAKGDRTFDFGLRQFHFVLGDDLKPSVRDAAGKLRANLPKPNQKDDPELAEQAIADWKLMKKQISAVVKLQATRLEQAMIEARRWSTEDFTALLMPHPLIRHLVQRLIWGGYSRDGKLLHTFRVAEDFTFSNEKDEVIDPKKIKTVGVLHPVLLTQESRDHWAEMFNDYEIIQPFSQIHRETYPLTPQEESAEEIKRFTSIKIPGVALARKLEQRGWQRGQELDSDVFRIHCKYFKSAHVTAVVGEYEHLSMSHIGDEVETITGCLFLQGKQYPYDYPSSASKYVKYENFKHKQLGQVDPVIVSEVLRDLSAIAYSAI